MRSFAELEAELDTAREGNGALHAARLLAVAEEALEQWVRARGATPTRETREGFRLLALHRQGAQDTPSFNACRETCREIAWHYNLLTLAPDPAEEGQRVRMMVLLARHLVLFVSGKMQVEALGEFCCASRPLRTESATMAEG